MFHSLDVTACGRALIDSERFSLKPLAHELGWELAAVEECFLVLLALHDAGKFSRAFQGLAPNLSPDLVPGNQRKIYSQRHDTLGWLLLCELLKRKHLDLPGSVCFWKDLFRIVTGHHGRPPKEVNGNLPLEYKHFFLDEDLLAGCTFADDLMPLLKPQPWPTPEKRHAAILRRHSYRLAGLCVLADWLGSQQSVFAYQVKPQALDAYWERTLPKAAAAVSVAGLGVQATRAWSTALSVLPELERLTPLQHYAATVDLPDKPQMFVLEDVTGSGKTEAALLLCHRLLAAGRASGVYFALPTMATANQMYTRVGKVYRRLFTDDAQPSLVLAHGARDLIDAFRESILQIDGPSPVGRYDSDEPTGAVQCAAWLADSRKKAMLADVGVGTIDQALLAVLPERHQSLRLLGLATKILIVDEVHAYDTYTATLLRKLLEVHGQSGGSAILLSATVPSAMRAELIQAFQGLDSNDNPYEVLPDARYPLATLAAHGEPLRTYACATRTEAVRTVKVSFLHQETHAIERVLSLSDAGRCVCWIRNTVHDAREGYKALCARLDPKTVTLFHSRFAMGDRLSREAAVVSRFGPNSRTADRSGQILVATQVVEQSLDLDFDEMVTDLAPIDLIIQRAGRLRRHLRPQDCRGGSAILHILAPAFKQEPESNWYSAMFPKASYVYENTGTLWRTMDVLLGSGSIVSPGTPDDASGVRRLVEAVYGEARPLPLGLQAAAGKVGGKTLAQQSQANYNTLNLAKGYCEEAGTWEHTGSTPTRLGDDSETIYLAREGGDGLEPFLPEGRYPWEMSAVRIRGQELKLTESWRLRFDPALKALRRKVPLLADEHVFVLPLAPDGEAWIAEISGERGSVSCKYSEEVGLVID